MLSEGSNLLTRDSELPTLLRPVRAAIVRRGLCRTAVIMLLLIAAGCAFSRRQAPTTAEVIDAGVTARVLISSDLDVNPAETVVKPDDPGQLSPDRSANGIFEA